MNKKKNKVTIKKSYEDAWLAVSRHHLLGTILSNIQLYPLEDNSPVWKNTNYIAGGFCYIKINYNCRAEVYIRKNNKFSKEDWIFVFSTLCVYLGLGLYKKYNENNLYIKQGLLLFAIHYVKNTLDFDFLPEDWDKFLELELTISFKNENSIIEQLQNKPELLEKTKCINFLNNYQFNDIEIKKENLGNYSWQGNKEFVDIFIENLISQAQKTIALRSNKNLSEEDLKKKENIGYKAKQWFEMHYPLLSSLSASFDIVEDIKICKQLDIQVGAVSAINKTIYINPLQLNLMGARFVIAHEILHIALDHANRRGSRDHLIWNLACDFVINNWLIEMNIGIPPNGLFFDKTLSTKSADEIYLMIANDVRLKKKLMTLKDMRAGDGNSKKSCDMLDQDTSYFAEFADACKEALLRGMFMHESCGRGDLPANLVEEIKAINQPVIPWQVELAEWIAEHFPLEDKKRSYARPSRRQSSTPEIPRPSYINPTYAKNTRTYGVILDTSASMDKQLLGKCLGAISSYSQSQEVKEVRLIFCDAQPYDEGFVAVEMLSHKLKMKGRGGTVLQQAVNYLENCLDFPEDAPILILTDGFFEESLIVKREHAFLVPNKHYLPINAKNVFEFK